MVKDNIHIKGMATTAGSLALINNIAEEDSAVVARLRDAGAIIGKIKLSEGHLFDLRLPPVAGVLSED